MVHDEWAVVDHINARQERYLGIVGHLEAAAVNPRKKGQRRRQLDTSKNRVFAESGGRMMDGGLMMDWVAWRSAGPCRPRSCC